MTYTTSPNSASQNNTVKAFALVVVSLVFAACNTYDPNLGDSPFRCGIDSPRCPDGYECVVYSASEEICERKGDDPGVRPDGGGGGNSDARDFVCNNDNELEPNEAITAARNIIIPSGPDGLRYVSLAICPSTDQDFFLYDNLTTGTNLVVEIEYQSAQGLLGLDILNSTGVSISSGMPAGGNPNILRATVANLSINKFYIQVRAMEGSENNYSILFQTP